ncbi:hypothetical protein NMY22_g3717 [Coprinellus aureogranulatus]|nr:hypothetical protein NMY22_g3717 [Coprinellus aureogranulatus]
MTRRLPHPNSSPAVAFEGLTAARLPHESPPARQSEFHIFCPPDFSDCFRPSFPEAFLSMTKSASWNAPRTSKDIAGFER